MKRYDALLCKQREYCELCDRPLEGNYKETQYELFRRRILDGAIEIKKMVICERCMKAIIEEIEDED